MDSDPRYICCCYDIMVNLSASHNDKILVTNHGLTGGEDKNVN